MLHTGGHIAAATRKLARVRHGVPVLMYHLVSDDVPTGFRKYTVTPRQFGGHVRTLTKLGCQSISPDELWAARHLGHPLPRRPVVITFDDGFRDCLRHAAPVLHAAGLRATMYVVAGLLGGTSRWMAPEGLALPLVTSSQARELEQAGIECQSHSLTHKRLAELESPEIARELSVSRRVLEDGAGSRGAPSGVPARILRRASHGRSRRGGIPLGLQHARRQGACARRHARSAEGQRRRTGASDRLLCPPGDGPAPGVPGSRPTRMAGSDDRAHG